MKKTFFILSIALLSISCNDDDVAPAEETNDALVTRISANGITKFELLYDVERRLSRINYYFLGTFSTYVLYEYNEDGLKELRRYAADDHSLNYRSVFTLDNFGRVINGENYSKPDFFNEVASINEFEYNGSGQLMTHEFRLPGDPVYSRVENTYDDEGNLLKQQSTHYPNQEDEYINYLSEYTPGSHVIPDNWDAYTFILGISGLDDDIRNMFISSFHFKGWSSNGTLTSDSNYETSEQAFNEDENLTSQVITRKNILNPQNPDVVTNMTYDYLEED